MIVFICLIDLLFEKTLILFLYFIEFLNQFASDHFFLATELIVGETLSEI